MTAGFDLCQTLECGQCFRWECTEDGAYEGIAAGRVLRVRPDEAVLLEADAFWRRYFDMDFDYPGVWDSLTEMGGAMAGAAAYAGGIRILNQEPWEALCTFILSQNNNIPRIKGIVARLCAAYGEPLGDGRFAFPTPDALAGATEEALRGLGTGFRARYLLDAGEKASRGTVDLEALREMPIAQARERLMTIVGVGPKVAECALLYGLHRLEAFPMDVWMKRAMAELFPGETPEVFGAYAGIAQQYIFHYIRTSGQGT